MKNNDLELARAIARPFGLIIVDHCGAHVSYTIYRASKHYGELPQRLFTRQEPKSILRLVRMITNTGKSEVQPLQRKAS